VDLSPRVAADSGLIPAVGAANPRRDRSAPEEARLKRMRSVDTLQRLYTMIMALALLPSISQVLSIPPLGQGQIAGASIQFRYELLPTFIAMIVTFVPFYHGASRYLDEAYIFGDKALASNKLNKLAVATDGALFFLHALAFYALALTLAEPPVCFSFLAAILILDCVWVITAQLHPHSRLSSRFLLTWLWLNIPSAVILVVIVVTPLAQILWLRWVIAAGLTVRTAIDYWLCWSFFWPGTDSPLHGWQSRPDHK
jgi:hypothetical protein